MTDIIGDCLIPRESNGAVPVNIQDQTSAMKDLYFVKSLGNQTTVKTLVTTDTYTVELDSATGFVDGTYIGIFCSNGQSYFGTQIGAPSGTTITLDTPFDFAYPVGCLVYNFTRDMNVDGSSTKQVFSVGPVGGAVEVQIDITRIHGIITDATAMDDGMFGGIAALTNGCVLRKNDGYFLNYGNFKTNGEIGLYAGTPISYNEKGPGGIWSAPFNWVFAGQGNRGVAIRLEPNETLEMIIQDDLTDLSSFRTVAFGHYVTN